MLTEIEKEVIMEGGRNKLAVNSTFPVGDCDEYLGTFLSDLDN